MRGKHGTIRIFARKGVDHPRRCGENFQHVRNAAFFKGSPPQVRGKRKTARAHSGRFRITPAGAGKTYIIFHVFSPWWDHPRRCGENCAPVMLERCPSGSPPQVRGKHHHIQAALSFQRITPAGAGKTDRIRLIELNRQDHPRRCGENCTTL